VTVRDPATAQVRAWLLVDAALALHVTDEALTGFLDFYNPLVVRIRERIGWFPMPRFTFPVWLTGLILLVILLAALTPVIRKQVLLGRVLSWILSVIMFGNGCGHLLGSVYFQRWLPGTTSAPLLIITSVMLMRSSSAGARTAYRDG
jgi:hypothetical protein